jgi:hypothetical protein
LFLQDYDVALDEGENMEINSDLDEDDQKDSPYFQKLRDKGNDIAKDVTGFTINEIIEIYEVVKTSIFKTEKRGRHSKLSSLDKLILVLVTLKHYTNFSKIGTDFEINQCQAQKTFSKIIKTIEKPLRKTYQVNLICENCESNKKYSLDVTIQPTNRLKVIKF